MIDDTMLSECFRKNELCFFTGIFDEDCAALVGQTQNVCRRKSLGIFRCVQQRHQRIHVFLPLLLAVGKIDSPKILHPLLGFDAGL